MRVLAATILLASSVASANAVVATDEAAQPPSPHVVDGRLGMLIGGADVGDVDGFSMGISAAIGYRFGDLSVRGLFDYYKVSDSSDEAMQRHGRGMRLGAALRYSLVNNGDEPGFGANFWGELGVGLEHVAWRQGGVLDRPSGELALGIDLGKLGELDRRGHRREIGYFMALRSFIGEAPDMHLPAACGGPCTQATPPPRTDVSMFFELGVHWGR